jgi:hypothetical protein
MPSSAGPPAAGSRRPAGRPAPWPSAGRPRRPAPGPRSGPGRPRSRSWQAAAGPRRGPAEPGQPGQVEGPTGQGQLQQRDHRQLVLAHRLVGGCPGEPHRLQHRPEGVKGDPGLLADLPVGPSRAHRPARNGEASRNANDSRPSPMAAAIASMGSPACSHPAARRTFCTSVSRNGPPPSRGTRMPSSTSRSTSAAVTPARSASPAADNSSMPPSSSASRTRVAACGPAAGFGPPSEHGVTSVVRFAQASLRSGGRG